MSLFETVRGGAHAYFDSAIMLLFFLLVGRYLDRRARGRARAAAERLLALGTRAVDGARGRRPAACACQLRMVAPGDDRAGRRRRADRGGRQVLDGASELDTSLITGETLPARSARAIGCSPAP